MTTDYSKSRSAVWIPILLAITTAIGSAGGWLYEKHRQDNLRSEEKTQLVEAEKKRRLETKIAENKRLLNEYLFKIDLALQSTKKISDELKSPQYIVKRGGDYSSHMYERPLETVTRKTPSSLKG